MSIYRLDPIDVNHPSWELSIEKDTLWVGAPTPNAARELVASRTTQAAAVAGECRFAVGKPGAHLVRPGTLDEPPSQRRGR